MGFLRLVFLLWAFSTASFAMAAMSTIDFVQVLNGNSTEADYYYRENWQALRKKAQKRGYIQSWQLLNVTYTEQTPYHYMLITTYADAQQFEQRESNFQKLIEEQGTIKLLNHIKPTDFRKTVNTTNAISLR
ncbi:hypothetical protein [Planctobacterium marinum]|uniref:NIPSNAP domain-containing protein n=1 Tax=Planctobacterium marinum TaxID=1631968 RepID=A0AA48I709_9ALTE|nr:hypothetical protein MACH26_26310 [Planctobacterium marinum]